MLHQRECWLRCFAWICTRVLFVIGAGRGFIGCASGTMHTPTQRSMSNTPALPLTIPLTDYKRGLLSMQVVVGAGGRLFLFDTAAGVTIITPELAGKLKCARIMVKNRSATHFRPV